MLATLDGRPIKKVPHSASFEAALQQLGSARVKEVREGLRQR
jgi:hypothetical protein